MPGRVQGKVAFIGVVGLVRTLALELAPHSPSRSTPGQMSTAPQHRDRHSTTDSREK